MKRVFSFCLLGVILSIPWNVAAATSEVVVSAAASLTEAFTSMKQAFEKKNPDVSILLNFASSGALLHQMRMGASVDVFASADQETMDKAQQEGFLDLKSRTNFAQNSLVVIVPKKILLLGRPENIKKVPERNIPKTLDDLTKMERIALGNPDSVPAGRYAKAALTTARLWERLESRYVWGSNVRQVLEYVARGEVDAGIVYASDILAQAQKVEKAFVLSGHPPITYPIAVTTLGKQKEAGQRFLAFVLSSEGQKILAEFGFSTVAQ